MDCSLQNLLATMVTKRQMCEEMQKLPEMIKNIILSYNTCKSNVTQIMRKQVDFVAELYLGK